jgi:Zn-dependent M16 (insulinase) family peptidase
LSLRRYSSPDSLLGRATQQALFPDNTYGVDSGGDPLVIPNLTFDEFKDFHAKYYHPSNSRIFFYGDDDPMQRLVLLDAELNSFDKVPVTSQVQFQPKNKKPERLEVMYPVAKDSEPKHSLTVNWLLNDKHLTSYEMLALGVLDSLLLGTSSAKLRKVLTESQLGESVTGGGLSDELLQATFGVGLKGVKPADVQRVEALVMSSLADISKEGFDQSAVDAALNTLEFRLREFNTGGFPKGLSIMLGMMSHWIYDKNAADGVRFEAALAELKADLAANKPVFQDLLKKFIVDNEHRVTMELKPDADLEAKVVEEEVQRLQKIKETLTEEQIRDVIESTKVLKEAQAREDSPEARATLPRLDLADIDPVNRELPIAVVKDGNNGADATILTHDLQTSGILYADIGFDFSCLEHEDLQLLPLLTRLLMEGGTETMDEVTLQRKIGAETGGIGVSLFSDTKSSGGVVSGVQPSDAILYLMVRGKATTEKVPVMLDLVRDILLTANLNNQKRAVEMLRESKIRKETSVITSGHTYAASRLASRYSFLGYLGELTGGLTSVRDAGKLLDMAENDWAALSARLVKMRDAIVKRNGMIVNLTGNDEVVQQAMPSVDSFLGALPTSESPKLNNLAATWSEDKLGAMANEGFVVPSQVNYVVKGGPIFSPGEAVSGSSSVVSRFLSLHYLWDNVRVMGGAYGGFARFSETSGRFVFMSYRDPNLKATLDIYDNAAKALADAHVGPEDILQGVIGAVGELDSPMSPDQKGYTSMVQYLNGESAAERQKWRDDVLGTSEDDFKVFAKALGKVAQTGSVSVVGSQSALDEANKALPDDKKLIVDKAF